jgi:hypothetical protein
MNKLNSLSIIDNTDIDSFKNTMGKIQQFQRLVRENLIEGKDYGTIPGTQKPTLYKAGAEKIVILGKLRSTFDILSETKDYEKEFFDFEIRWNLWAGDNLLVQGVGLCNSKEDKYRYRWITEKKLPSNVDKSKLVFRNKMGKYGDYKEYRMVNEDVCTLANTILKMAKKRALVDAALLVGSLSDLFTQDMEDLPKEYIDKEDTSKEKEEVKPETKSAKAEPEKKPATKEQKDKLTEIIKDKGVTKEQLVWLKKVMDNGVSYDVAEKVISMWEEKKKKEKAPENNDKPETDLPLPQAGSPFVEISKEEIDKENLVDDILKLSKTKNIPRETLKAWAGISKYDRLTGCEIKTLEKVLDFAQKYVVEGKAVV